jgi:hypothetical protein
MEGETLESHPGSYAGAEPPWSFEYEWYRCNNGGAGCYPLGVKGAHYTLTTGDIGSRMRTWVAVTGQDCGEWNYSNMTRECRATTVFVPSEATPVIDSNPTFLPTSAAPPSVSGIAEEGEHLSADDGDWTGLEPIALLRQWERCSAAGDACQAIPGAIAETYVLGTSDVGRTIRVVLSGKNVRGVSAPVASEATEVVAPLRPRPGRTVIDVAKVARPHRLVIDRFSFEPSLLRAPDPVTVRIRISDTRGFRVRGAIVSVAGVRAGLIGTVRDARTGSDGWTTLRLRPTARVVFRVGGSIELVVRAFRSGESAVGGVSARRLLSLPLGAPRG